MWERCIMGEECDVDVEKARARIASQQQWLEVVRLVATLDIESITLAQEAALDLKEIKDRCAERAAWSCGICPFKTLAEEQQ